MIEPLIGKFTPTRGGLHHSNSLDKMNLIDNSVGDNLMIIVLLIIVLFYIKVILTNSLRSNEGFVRSYIHRLQVMKSDTRFVT